MRNENSIAHKKHLPLFAATAPPNAAKGLNDPILKHYLKSYKSKEAKFTLIIDYFSLIHLHIIIF